MKDKWRLLKTSSVYNDNVLNIIHKNYHYNKIDATMDFTVVEISSWATVIPITRKGDILIVKQFRAGNEKDTLEFPGGSINKNEIPIDAARRELKEETGAITSNLIELGQIEPNPAFMNNTCHIFLAIDCVIDSEQELDLFEDAEVLQVTKDELDNMIINSSFSQSISLAAYSLFLLKKDKVKI